MKDISLHLMDIMQNSVKANSSLIKIVIEADKSSGLLNIKIIDNGNGMDKDFLEKVTDPFITTRTTRKIGLGIPLLKLSAEITGGCFSITSEVNKGTSISVSYVISNIDRIPLGDIGDTITGTILGNPNIDYQLLLSNTEQQFIFSSKDIEKTLNGVPITEFDILNWIKEYINENVHRIFVDILPELQ